MRAYRVPRRNGAGVRRLGRGGRWRPLLFVTRAVFGARWVPAVERMSPAPRELLETALVAAHATPAALRPCRLGCPVRPPGRVPCGAVVFAPGSFVVLVFLVERRARRALARLAHAQRPSADHHAVELLDRLVRESRLVELDEREPARAVRDSVQRHDDVGDVADRGERGLELLPGRIEAQVSYEHFRRDGDPPCGWGCCSSGARARWIRSERFKFAMLGCWTCAARVEQFNGLKTYFSRGGLASCSLLTWAVPVHWSRMPLGWSAGQEDLVLAPSCSSGEVELQGLVGESSVRVPRRNCRKYLEVPPYALHGTPRGPVARRGPVRAPLQRVSAQDAERPGDRREHQEVRRGQR